LGGVKYYFKNGSFLKFYAVSGSPPGVTLEQIGTMEGGMAQVAHYRRGYR
jgi:hypothetical protein